MIYILGNVWVIHSGQLVAYTFWTTYDSYIVENLYVIQSEQLVGYKFWIICGLTFRTTCGLYSLGVTWNSIRRRIATKLFKFSQSEEASWQAITHSLRGVTQKSIKASQRLKFILNVGSPQVYYMRHTGNLQGRDMCGRSTQSPLTAVACYKFWQPVRGRHTRFKPDCRQARLGCNPRCVLITSES